MENNNRSLEETFIIQGIDKEIYGEFGLDFAYRANVNKLKNIKHTGGSAMRDALERANTILIGLNVLLTDKTYDNYSFFHILITNNEDKVSKTTFEESYSGMNTVNNIVMNLQTFFIAFNFGTEANTEMLQLTKAGGENTIYYNIHDDELNDIFKLITNSILCESNIKAAIPGNKELSRSNYTHKIVLFTLDTGVSVKPKWQNIIKCIDRVTKELSTYDLIGYVLFNDKVNVLTSLRVSYQNYSANKSDSSSKINQSLLRKVLCSRKVQIIIIVTVAIIFAVLLIIFLTR
jgi:uncharacterized protein YegL